MRVSTLSWLCVVNAGAYVTHEGETPPPEDSLGGYPIFRDESTPTWKGQAPSRSTRRCVYAGEDEIICRLSP